MSIQRIAFNGPAKKVLFYLLAVLLGGCVPVLSLHSLYTKDPNVPESTQSQQ